MGVLRRLFVQLVVFVLVVEVVRIVEAARSMHISSTDDVS
jgi:cell division septal protein FtsQ